MRRTSRIPTEEEHEQNKKTILEMLQQGLPGRRIEAKLDFSRSYIKKIRESLIAEGAITEEQIQVASKKYYAENPNAQGLNKTKVRKPKSTEKAEKRHARSMASRERVFELVKQGYAQVEIAEELEVSETSVKWHITALIEEGRISKDDIKKANSATRKSKIDKTSEDYISKRDQVIELLRLGWKNSTIRNKLELTPFFYNYCLRDIKASKLMSSAEIKEAREAKHQEDLAFVESGVLQGLSLEQIRGLKPEFSYNEVTPMIKELIEAGKITQEQVDANSIRQGKITLNKNAVLSPEEQTQYIFEKVRAGYTPQEIVDSDTTKSLSMHKVLYQKRKLIADGAISQEEADEAMKQHQATALNKKHDNDRILVRNYVMLGYTQAEITDILGCSSSYLTEIKQKYVEQGEWFTLKEIREFERQRKEREEQEAFDNLSPEEQQKYLEAKRLEEERIAEEKRQKEEAHKNELAERKQARIDAKAQIHGKDLLNAKRLIKTGITVEEVAKKMNCSVPYIYELRSEALANGIWLTEKELAELKKKKLAKTEANRAKRKAEKVKAQEERIEEDRKRKIEQVWEFRSFVEKGLTDQEIAEAMHYSLSTISVIKRRAIQMELWFSQESLESFKKEREIREAKEAKAREEAEQKRIAEERKKLEKLVKEEEERKKAFESERRRKIRSFASPYKTLRKTAKAEDKDELDGKENVSTEGRQKFAEVLEQLENLQADISQKDIEIITNALDMHPEIATKSMIKFLISNAGRRDGFKGAELMAKSLAITLEETKFKEPLVEYSKWIKRQSYIPKMQEMLKSGYSMDFVADRFRLSTAEVKILLSPNKNTVDFFGDGNR